MKRRGRGKPVSILLSSLSGTLGIVKNKYISYVSSAFCNIDSSGSLREDMYSCAKICSHHTKFSRIRHKVHRKPIRVYLEQSTTIFATKLSSTLFKEVRYHTRGSSLGIHVLFIRNAFMQLLRGVMVHVCILAHAAIFTNR